MARKTRVIAADDPGYRAQGEYTPAFLTVYDALVLGLFCRSVWHASAADTVRDYERHVGRRHLEIGPGTGYFLANARLPADVEITLADRAPPCSTMRPSVWLRTPRPRLKPTSASRCP